MRTDRIEPIMILFLLLLLQVSASQVFYEATQNVSQPAQIYEPGGTSTWMYDICIGVEQTPNEDGVVKLFFNFTAREPGEFSLFLEEFGVSLKSPSFDDLAYTVILLDEDGAHYGWNSEQLRTGVFNAQILSTRHLSSVTLRIESSSFTTNTNFKSSLCQPRVPYNPYGPSFENSDEENLPGISASYFTGFEDIPYNPYSNYQSEFSIETEPQTDGENSNSQSYIKVDIGETTNFTPFAVDVNSIFPPFSTFMQSYYGELYEDSKNSNSDTSQSWVFQDYIIWLSFACLCFVLVILFLCFTVIFLCVSTKKDFPKQGHQYQSPPVFTQHPNSNLMYIYRNHPEIRQSIQPQYPRIEQNIGAPNLNLQPEAVISIPGNEAYPPQPHYVIPNGSDHPSVNHPPQAVISPNNPQSNLTPFQFSELLYPLQYVFGMGTRGFLRLVVHAREPNDPASMQH